MVATAKRKSKAVDSQLTGIEKIFDKLSLKKGMSINRAIVYCSEYIDGQTNPLKVANAIIQTLEVPLPYISEPTQAKILALATIEQALVQDTFDPEKAADIATDKFNRIHKRMPYAVKGQALTKSKRGGKRDVARQIYLENKGLDDKDIIKLVQEALDISPQNAYTYVYLVIKSLKV